jgi:hypothetical protein
VLCAFAFSDRRLSDRRPSDGRISDRRLSNRRLSDRRLSDRRLSDRRLSDRSLDDGGSIGWRRMCPRFEARTKRSHFKANFFLLISVSLFRGRVLSPQLPRLKWKLTFD